MDFVWLAALVGFFLISFLLLDGISSLKTEK